MPQVRLSTAEQGTLGIVGHVGCGHANSHCGFVQDDSGGLATVLLILQRATQLDLTIREVIPRVGREGALRSASPRGALPMRRRVAA